MKKTFYVGKRNVGWLEDGVFRKVVQKSKHLFLRGDSWAIDYDVLKQLPDNGEIRLRETEDEVIYLTTVKRMRRGGVLNLGHGAQVFLPRNYWDTIKDGTRTDSEIAAGQDWAFDYFNSLPDFERDAQGNAISHAKTVHTRATYTGKADQKDNPYLARRAKR
jgi:hypothetical protein